MRSGTGEPPRPRVSGGARGGRPGPRQRDDRRDPPPQRPTAKGPKPPLWTKLAIIFGATVMVASGASVVVPKLLVNWAVGDIPQVDALPPTLSGNDISGAIDFLLLGTDAGEGSDSSHTGRLADSIVLVHIPATHDVIYMISFPRDMRVPIAPSVEQCGGSESRINEAYAAGVGDGDLADPNVRGQGAARTAKTISCLVEETGGLTFEGAGIVNFDGFDRIVQALGSVYMCFDDDVWSIHYKADGTPWYFAQTDSISGEIATRSQRYHYPEGECRDLQPWEALDYSRQRKGLADGDGDYGRQRHQQQLLRAIVREVASTDTMTNFATIGRLRDAAGGLLTLDLNEIPIEDWVITLSGLRADDIIMIRTNGGDYAGSQDENGNYDGERMTPEFQDLLRNVQNDTVLNFLANHPDWVAPDATGAPNSSAG